jgi:hypothetical protein
VTNPRELLDAYAAAEAIDDDYKHPTYEQVAPEAIAALRAVLELHSAEDGGSRWCPACRLDTGEPVDRPCPTEQAIIKALTTEP